MRDVVVIGGGLSGLSACYELERRGAAYTVIEVKRRFGGGIRSARQDGFIMDASAFAFRPIADDALLDDLRLQEQVIQIGSDSCAFAAGSETLISALAGRLGGGRLMRMALSSVGRLDGRFTICLENGIMLDAGALILALPARYAARALWNLAPEAAEQLARFRYDAIRRVSLGYHKRDLPRCMERDLDETFPFIITTDQPERLPDRDHRLIQVGLRSADDISADDAISLATKRFAGSAPPLVAQVDYWAEADLLPDYSAAHRNIVSAICRLLPEGLSLIGSDYCREAPNSQGVARLGERIQTGRRAACDALSYLRAAGGR